MNNDAQQKITGRRPYLTSQRGTAQYWTSSGHRRALPNAFWDPAQAERNKQNVTMSNNWKIDLVALRWTGNSSRSVTNLFSNILYGQLFRSHFIFFFYSLRQYKKQQINVTSNVAIVLLSIFTNHVIACKCNDVTSCR